MELTDSGEDGFEGGLLAEGRGLECMVMDGIMIMLPTRSMLVDNAEPKRTLMKLPTWGSWGFYSDIDDAGEVEVEYDNIGVLGWGDTRWNVMRWRAWEVTSMG